MRQQKNSLVLVFIKSFFLLLFINYMASISFFTHSHVVNGVTIVHSHPYPLGEGGTDHEHTGTQLQLIEMLSVFYIVGSILFVISFVRLLTPLCNLFDRVDSIIPLSLRNSFLFSRPPPVW